MKIAFLTLGCKLNYAETSTYERGFRQHGMEVVQSDEPADVYLVNTCSVTQHSDNKCRNIIRKCHRLAPDAAIIVTGCYAELKRDEIAAIEGVKLVFGAKEKNRVVPESLEFLRSGVQSLETAQTDLSLAQEYKRISSDTLAAFSSGERTRSFLKVQDGCNNFCAYCTVPYARGASRNIPIGELVSQAGQIAAEGIKEIVLTGVNTGDFGRSTGESFLDLLKALNEVEGIERYRISSIEPNLITEEIVDWIALGTKFQPHFHIPLQSGSDWILERMGRRYSTSFFAGKLKYIREKLEGEGRPKVFFGIDVIVGLPGETEAMFRETCDFLEKEIHPAFIHVFPYSRRPGTRAWSMPDQVQDSVKTSRVAVLEELSGRLYREFVESNKGVCEKILWESSSKAGFMSGYTGNYIRLETAFDSSRVGTIEDVRL